ncbi:class I SAM-dependent methyltransferase [Methylobacter sp.]|uniref:class I SAM-dependent methyltransferase n=1 Tax=Methylobacter sp. TaxID=2051955 RepID=UPI00122599B7|nr:class I SAM-dependent methyltransferase [Methylobacter sp.]TAK64223.1 MAG: class I SAM-dependent methyltransferase [Methylobacter sp.]
MAQITSGIRAIFSSPLIYSSFQNIMGAHSIRSRFVEEFIRPISGCTILDIGCGPADILAYLPEVYYCGFDISVAYIAQAKTRFSQQGKFYCQELTHSDVEKMPQVDIVLALGLLHHLDDEMALDVMRLASQALKPGGRLLTFDPCFDAEQNFISRFLVGIDRGQNVRTREGYKSIASAVFESPRVEVRHRSWIPYTHCFMECTRK